MNKSGVLFEMFYLTNGALIGFFIKPFRRYRKKVLLQEWDPNFFSSSFEGIKKFYLRNGVLIVAKVLTAKADLSLKQMSYGDLLCFKKITKFAAWHPSYVLVLLNNHNHRRHHHNQQSVLSW